MIEQTWIDPRCTRAGWPEGPWDSEPDKVQWKDADTGIVCLAKRHPRSGHWCGYVGVTPGHPWHGLAYDDVPAEVHWGLTFANHCQEGPPELTVCHIPDPGEPEHLYWLGFDCAHCDDYSPQDAAYARDKGYPFTIRPEEEYRDLDYIRNECRDLARQAAGATVGKTVLSTGE